jgi:hypothetical protein
MPNKQPTYKFAETIPMGIVAIVCAIGALSVLLHNLMIACLLSLIGFGIGIVTLRMQAERLDKILAMIEIVLSFIPVIYAIVIFMWK